MSYSIKPTILSSVERLVYESEFNNWCKKSKRYREKLRLPSVPPELRKARAIAIIEEKPLPPLPEIHVIDYWYDQVKSKELK
jgi:hypothetical protein